MSNDNLPPLPLVGDFGYRSNSSVDRGVRKQSYSPEQMDAHGQACYEAGKSDAVAALEKDRDEWKRIATQAIDSNAELTADAVAASGVLHAAQSRMWTALDKKACPGVWMQIASDAILNFKTDSYGGDIAAAPTPDRATKAEAASRNAGVPAVVREAVEAAFEGREGWMRKIAAAVRALADAPATEAPTPVAAPAGAVTDLMIENLRADTNATIAAAIAKSKGGA